MKTKRNKKIQLILMVSMMMLTCMFPVKTYAGTNHQLQTGYYPGYSYRFTRNGYSYWGQGFWITVDGLDAFCVDPSTEAQGGGGYVGADFSLPQRLQMELIAYYGLESHKSASDAVNWRLASQFMIYETMGFTPVSITGFDYPSYKSQIQNAVNRHTIRPSFANQSFEVNLGESITLTDTNGVLSEYADVESQSGVTVVRNGNQITLTPTETASGKITLSFNKVPKNYLGTSILYRRNGAQDAGVLRMRDPQSMSIQLTVNKYGNLSIAKQDEEGNFVPNTSFQISYNADMSDPVGIYTTGEDGTVLVEKLKPQTTYVQETKVPENLILDPRIHTIQIVPNETVSFNAVNQIQKGNITLQKQDQDTGNIPQGEATLKGAVYGLYAKENIMNPITNKIYHAKGKKLAEVITDETGKTKGFTDLYLGSYYIQEIKAPNGYQLDKTKYPVELVYGGQNVNVVTLDKTLSDQVITGKFSIQKNIENKEDNELMEPEKGAQFTAIAKKYVDQYGSFEEAMKHFDTYADKEYAVVETDENGQATSNELAYGDYILKQTGTADSDILLFKDEITFRVNKQDQKFHYTIKNTWYQSLLKLVKKDMETNQVIALAGTSFQVKDLETGNYLKQKVGGKWKDTFTTDDTGTVTLPMPIKANKHLQLEEVTAPNGYLLNKKPILFTITVSNITASDPDGVPITVVEMKDQPVKGKINIQKMGEVLDGVKKDTNGNIQFVYKKQALVGMKVNLIASKDILNPADQSVLYKKGAIVKTGTTTKEGLVFEKLPLGEYDVQEVSAPNGFVLNPKKHHVSLTYQDDETAIISKTVVIENDRQKVKVNAKKQDKELGESIKGAEISLFANEDIVLNDQLVIQKDTKIETVKTNQDGYALFKSKLPLGMKWYLKETKAPKNYKKTDDVFYFETTYGGQNQDQIVFTHMFQNEVVKGKMSFVKKGEVFTHTDIGQTELGVVQTPVFETKNLIGAKIAIYAAEDIKPSVNNTYYAKDELIQILESDIDPVTSKELPVGKYYWKEIQAPIGYVIDEEMHYVTISGKEQEHIEVISQSLWNHRPRYQIAFTKRMKQSEYDEEQFTKAYQDVVFGIFTRDDTYDWFGHVAISPDTLVATSGINEDGTLTNIAELPVGNYYLKEMKTHEAYILDKTEYDFTISQSSNEIEHIQINDGKPIENALKKYRVQVNKVDSFTNQSIVSKDFAFTLFKDQVCKEVLITKNANQENGTVVFEDLPYGTYYIKETKAPVGYLLNDEVVKVEINSDGVFANEKQLTKENNTYSFNYVNQTVPNIETGINDNMYGYLLLYSLSTMMFIGLWLLRKKRV